jgi:CRISPR-associated protein Csd1
LNSPTSEKAAFAYTTVLNFLLSRENDYANLRIGDTTIVYWAESPDPAYQATVSILLNPALQEQGEEEDAAAPRDKRGELRLHEIAQKLRTAAYLDADLLLEEMDETTRFYVLGLAPNAARVSVRFFHTDPFHKVVEKILTHYQDLQIEKEFENQPTYIPLWQLLRETVSPKASSPQVSPLLGGAVMRAIFSGGPYPAALYTAIITRIRADMDDKEKRIEKINYVRAAIIKACLTRKYRHQPEHPIQEVITMGLNEQSTNQAYLLGRLFAVLEKAQVDAIGKANASIKDRYFTSACATPASVFPVLLRLSQHHISKARYGYVNDNRIAEIMNRLDVENDPIPARLSLDEQGIFVLGYYQQRVALYTKTKPDAADETDETSEVNQ